MKRNLKKFLGIVLVLIGLSNNFCYADSILMSDIQYFYFYDGGAYIIGGAVIVIMLISIYILDVIVNKNTNNAQEKSIKFYITMIIVILLHCISLSFIFDTLSMILWIIPIALLIYSKLISKRSERKSGILRLEAIFIITIILIYNIVNVYII